MAAALDTHGFVMPLGRHKGELITRVPVSYLKWMVNARHSAADYAQAELVRRGTVTPELDISGHAIDRASLLCWKTWERTRHEDEGLHAWLCRMAAEALKTGRRHETEAGRITHASLSFRFNLEGVWPVLLTVLPREGDRGSQNATLADTMKENA